ncbi:hypothetical protein L1049_008420 [Liquidambar formosana]|uniref:DUF4005 domain-containing protein n=1 Tax=Liquidambar formosana TaxID=63359 RepID=A0AAP0S3I0_LIQFO
MSFHESSMAKKKSWFSFVKKLFVSEAKPKAEKKPKRWRCVFGRLTLKQYPALAAPQIRLSEAREEQRKHAVNVAIATAAAVEAAVAAAHAAAEVVRLTGASQPYNLCDKGNWNLAATKIQTAFRGHLARKAFRALRGLVRLQAMVRGRIVRHQAIKKLKHFPSISNLQSQVHEQKFSNVDQSCKDGEKLLFLRPKKEMGENAIKLECNTRRSWDESLFSKEDMEVIQLRKQEAIAKRERMKKYSFSHRERRNVQMPEESAPDMDNGRLNFQLEKWSNAEAYRMEELENLKPTVHSNAQKYDMIESLNSPILLPRRSFCRIRQNSIGDDSSFPSSPAFPTYMAATESAKVKARSMSTPKQRLGSFLGIYSDHSSPYKNELSTWSSFNGKSISTNGNSGTSRRIYL